MTKRDVRRRGRKDACNQEDENNIIGQYVIFCKVYDEQRKMSGQTKKAILETIHICKDRNVLKEYLKEKELEVTDIMTTLFSQEDVLGAYAKEIADNVAREAAIITEKNSTGNSGKINKVWQSAT